MRPARARMNANSEILWIRLWIVWISPSFCLLHLMQPIYRIFGFPVTVKATGKGKEVHIHCI